LCSPLSGNHPNLSIRASPAVRPLISAFTRHLNSKVFAQRPGKVFSAFQLTFKPAHTHGGDQLHAVNPSSAVIRKIRVILDLQAAWLLKVWCWIGV
jgi:hypothetical protein